MLHSTWMTKIMINETNFMNAIALCSLDIDAAL